MISSMEILSACVWNTGAIDYHTPEISLGTPNSSLPWFWLVLETSTLVFCSETEAKTNSRSSALLNFRNFLLLCNVNCLIIGTANVISYKRVDDRDSVIIFV